MELCSRLWALWHEILVDAGVAADVLSYMTNSAVSVTTHVTCSYTSCPRTESLFDVNLLVPLPPPHPNTALPCAVETLVALFLDDTETCSFCSGVQRHGRLRTCHTLSPSPDLFLVLPRDPGSSPSLSRYSYYPSPVLTIGAHSYSFLSAVLHRGVDRDGHCTFVESLSGHYRRIDHTHATRYSSHFSKQWMCEAVIYHYTLDTSGGTVTVTRDS